MKKPGFAGGRGRGRGERGKDTPVLGAKKGGEGKGPGPRVEGSGDEEAEAIEGAQSRAGESGGRARPALPGGGGELG